MFLEFYWTFKILIHVTSFECSHYFPFLSMDTLPAFEMHREKKKKTKLEVFECLPG